jgi:DNA repair exonuclease SbcCD ATPase subunit
MSRTDKIISLEVKNVKRVKAVTILANGTMNVISGKNGNGKSSTLDSIEMALRGGKHIPDMPIRAGEETARIVIETDEMTITRHWTSPEKTYLKVETKQFGKVANAQDTLNAIVGNLSFDPLEFSTMESKKRVSILKEISKLDFTELDEEYKKKFDERTGVKKEEQTLAATVNSFEARELDKPEFDIKDIEFKREQANKHNSVLDRLRDVTIPEYKKIIDSTKGGIQNYESLISQYREDIEGLNKKITAAEEAIVIKKTSLVDTTVALNESEQELENSKKIPTSEFDEMFKTYANYEANLKMAKQRQEIISKRDEATMKVTSLTTRLDEIKLEKETLLTNAQMPIKGLSFSSQDVLFNDIPFIQLSTSEQIQVSMSIAMALNPRLRIIIIKNGSLLDSDAMKKIYDLAHENNFQIWLEKVADTPDGNSIFIEDGEVYGAEKTEEATDTVQVHTGDEAGVL